MGSGGGGQYCSIFTGILFRNSDSKVCAKLHRFPCTALLTWLCTSQPGYLFWSSIELFLLFSSFSFSEMGIVVHSLYLKGLIDHEIRSNTADLRNY